MEAPIIIEILDRFGKVRERYKLVSFPVRIGRAYSNDIILDDSYVSPEHIELMLDGDGHIMVTDLNSDNGLFSLHPIRKHDVLTLEENQRIRIGHTDIRIRSENFSVASTFIDHGKPSIFHFMLTNGFMLPIILLLTAGITLEYYYLQVFRDVTFNSLLSDIFPIFTFIVLWALGWSIVSKLTTHKFYFVYHAILISLIICGFYVIEPGLEYIEFVFPVNNLSYNLSTLSDLVLVSLLFYGHLRQSSNLSRKRTRIFSVAATLVLIGFIHLTNYINSPEYNSSPAYSKFMKAPLFSFRKAQSLDDFLAATAELKNFNISSDKKTSSN